MKYANRADRYRFFVYRTEVGKALDLRCPLSGLTVHAHDEIEAIEIGFQRAYQRYECNGREVLAVVLATDQVKRRQAWLMERAEQRELQLLEELMGVGG